MIKHVTHWIDGRGWDGPAAVRHGELFDPATGAVTGRVDFASVSEVDRAVSAAAAAFPAWRAASVAKRTQGMFAFRQLLDARRAELATRILAEPRKGHA